MPYHRLGASSFLRKAALPLVRQRAYATGAAATGSSAGPRRMSMAPRAGTRGPSAAMISNETIQQLTAEIDEMKLSVDSLERERDFYFGKLRDVEVVLQERLGELVRPTEDGEELVDPAGASETDTLKQIQAILYQTEEGFELPDAAEVRICLAQSLTLRQMEPEPADDMETF